MQWYENPSKVFPYLSSKLDSDKMEVILSIQQRNFCMWKYVNFRYIQDEKKWQPKQALDFGIRCLQIA